MPQECVHTLPSGSKVHHNTTHVTHHYPDGVVKTFSQCQFTTSQSPVRQNYSTTGDQSHAYPVIMWGPTVSDTDSFSATYNVPQAPVRNSNQVVYWWFGVETPKHDIVVQPVLGFRGGEWVWEAWNCCPKGHATTGPTLSVAPGDTLKGTILKQSDETFVVTAEVNGKESRLEVDDDAPMTNPLLSLETYGVKGSCDLLPSSAMEMSHISEQPKVAWSGTTNDYQGWDITTCGWRIDLSDDYIRLVPETALVV